MSLFKQLWLAIFIIIVFCLVGSFALMTFSAKTYLETQLYQKNVDSANSLALNLGTTDFNAVTTELKLASQFDSGHYKLIRLIDTENNIIVEKINDKSISKIPTWFVQLINIDPPSGKAKVANGWRQLGEIEIASSSQFAYHELWRNTFLLAIYFLITGIISGLTGHYILRVVTEPLKQVVKQTEAIGNRRFITTKEPKTLEFKQVVISMNKLSKRVQTMLAETGERLHSSLDAESKDKSTQLLRREPLLDQIHAYLRRDDHTASGIIALLQLFNFQETIKLLGTKKSKKVIDSVSQHLNHFLSENSHACIGRLDDENFVIVLPDTTDASTIIESLAVKLHNELKDLHFASDTFFIGSSNYSPREDWESILERLDSAIQQLQQNYNTETDNKSVNQRIVKHVFHEKNQLPNSIEMWSTVFELSLLEEKFQLNLFPVIDREQSLLHLEAPIRLHYQDSSQQTTLLNAGQFLGWARRCDKMTDIDIAGLSLAFSWLEKQNNDIGINISPELLANQQHQTIFIETLSKHKPLANRLWIETPENGVYHYLDEFKLFAEKLSELGCHIGIEHAGHSIEKIGLIHDIGVDYIKIDSAFIRSINNNQANQIFLQGVVSIAHTIGIKVIAEGVQDEQESECLWRLGFDGQTGPSVGIAS